MKALVLILVAVLAAAASRVEANDLYAAWGDCYDSGGASKIVFDCTPGRGTRYELFHSFTIDADMTNFIAAQGIVDLEFPQEGVVPPWWMLSGGCNDGGLGFDYLRGTACSGNSPLLCGTTPEACAGSTIVAEWIGGTGGYPGAPPNMARFLWVVARPTTSPVDLPAGRYYAWRMIFLMDNPGGLGPCAGCDAVASIGFRMLDVFDLSGGGPEIGYPCSIIDPCPPPPAWATACANCDAAVPVRAKTWGQLKALYR